MDKFYRASRSHVLYRIRAAKYGNGGRSSSVSTKHLHRCYHGTAQGPLARQKVIANRSFRFNKHLAFYCSWQNEGFLQEGKLVNLLSRQDDIRQMEQEYDSVMKQMEQLDKSLDEHNDNNLLNNDMANQGLAEICDGYSKAQGSYVAWDNSVNLDPPKTWNKPAPEGDVYLQDYYNSLQYTLYETGHPETVDRTFKPRTQHNNEHVNVVLLSSPVECIGILLEGGKQVPDGFHLVMSPSWLSKVPSKEDPSLYSLLMHKSISFHENGASYIDEYDPPRQVSYFVNYFTDTITSGHRNDGVDIEKHLDCPMSSSIKLCELVDDKVLTRDVMADVGMTIPQTLAIRRHPIRTLSSAKEDIKVLNFSRYSSLDINVVENEIATFAKRLKDANIKTIVVKPSGPKYLGSVGISFHDTSDVTSIVAATDNLLQEIDESCSVLIEEFIEPLMPQDVGTHAVPLWSANDDLGFRVRSTVCRDHDDTPVTTLINCAIANKHSPINGDNTVCQSLNSTLLAYNVLDDDERTELERTIRVQSADVLERIMEREIFRSKGERGELRGQTDVIGIDMIVTKRAGKLVPVGIEVNSHDCTINTQLYDFMMNLGENMLVNNKTKTSHLRTKMKIKPEITPINQSKTTDSKEKTKARNTNEDGETKTKQKGRGSKNLYHFIDRSTIQESRYFCGKTVGQSVRPLVRNMISRSQKYMVKGKQIVVIGGGGYSKRNIWQDAEQHGINITLVDSDANHLAKNQVHRFIHYDFDEHKKDFAHACNIYNLLQAQEISVDGCLTFWEDCGPLAALVNEMMGTKGSGYKAALTGKKKSRTQNVLSKCKADIPHWPRTYLYSSKSVHIESENDSVLVPKSLTFPAILKLEHGSSAVGVSVVKDEEEVRKTYHQISENFRSESDFPGIGLGHDNTMMAMEYHKGSEHDVDVIMYNRKLIGAFISDNGPTRHPYFTETAAVMPSCLPSDKQAQLIVAAYQCCTEIGLTSGTFNVELLMTGKGPKLIEINARMGGFYLREWIRSIYGVDLVLASLMISCGIKPYIPKLPTDKVLMGVMLIPSAHAHVLNESKFRTQLKGMIEKNEILYTQFSELVEPSSSEYEEPFGNIAVAAETAEEAKEKLLRVCDEFGITSDEYHVKHFLKHF